MRGRLARVACNAGNRANYSKNDARELHGKEETPPGKRRFDMDGALVFRIVAGVLFVILLGVLIQRRRTRVK